MVSLLNQISSSDRPGAAESLSSTDDDELGHISPLDLNLGFDHISKAPKDGEHPYVNVPKRPSPISPNERVAKENWTPNGAVKVIAPPASPESLSPPSDPLTQGNPDRKKPAGSPAAKKRFSSRRPKPEVPVYAQVNKSNNTNNNNLAPVKPRSLPVSSSIVQRSKKFLASVKDSSSPTVPVKYARKMLHSPSVSWTFFVGRELVLGFNNAESLVLGCLASVFPLCELIYRVHSQG